MLELTMATSYVNESDNSRLVEAQRGFLRGCLLYGIIPVFYADPLEHLNGRPKFGDVLKLARRHSESGYMLWCNSDCELIDDPRHHFTVGDGFCYGMHRQEVPDRTMCLGVDMYVIPNQLWDEYLSRDIPDMYIGATKIDWWITRACQKIGRYKFGGTILDHPRHDPGNVTAGMLNFHNENSFNEWAIRNNVDRG